MAIITVENLEFSYKRGEPIINKLNLLVPENSIYGFLGRNGAGKTTTIRNLLGLLQPHAGTIRIFDQDVNGGDRSLYHKIGALIESPALYPNLSAEDHLRLACRYQQVSEKRIPVLLERVGLLHARHKLSKKFSTGMKQRLGLAMSLLHEPDLLILDEPTNGLDPEGISDIRKLLQELREEGKTILLSSHLLSEIEKVTTHVGIIREGHLLFEGDQAALQGWKSKQQILEIRTNKPQQVTIQFPDLQVISVEDQKIQLQSPEEAQIPHLVRQLVEAGLDIYELKLLHNDLEQLFMELNQQGV